MATTPTKPGVDLNVQFAGAGVSAWPRGAEVRASSAASAAVAEISPEKPSHRDALQALLAFAALHDQLRRRKTLASRHLGIDAGAPTAEFEEQEHFVLDEVLQLVAERGISITGADGLAIALAQNNEIVLRAAAGTVRPDVGARIERDSAFSGACFTEAQIVTCDDTETDLRVNVDACRKLGARSMVAVPLCGRRRVIGVLEAFSSWPFGFNDSDVQNLSLLAELVVSALRPEDEDRFAQSAQVAATKLEPPAKPKIAPAPEVKVEAQIKVEAPRVVATTSSGAAVAPAKIAPVEKPAVATSAATPVPREQPAVQVATIAPEIPQPTAPLQEKRVEEAAPVAAVQTTPEPALTFGQSTAETERKPITLYLLIAIVIVAAFAGGVWWKLNAAKLGSAIVTRNAAPNSSISKTDTPAAPSPATSAETDVSSGAEEEEASPATPQEMSKFPRVTNVRHWSSTDSSTVVLDLEDQVQYEAHRLANPDRIYFDLHDTQLAPELMNKSIDIGDALLNRMRVAQPIAGMTRVVLETKANTTFSVSLEPNPYRLLVEVRKVGSTPKSSVNLFPNAGEAEKNKLAIVVPPPTKEDLKLRALVQKMKIVVDAGHGGWDLGTVGKRGLLEKDLVFEISQRLGKLLESRLGADVIYTRPDDNYITLDERASIANQSQADLFVSVHANYSDLPSARGVETYYTNFFTAPNLKDAGQKDVDTRASAATLKNMVTPNLSPTELHDRIEQSRKLAASVQRSLYGTLSTENAGLRDRGTKEASFVVLTESAMPGILAEVSFVSSPTDEQKLRSDGYREQIAEALYRGIARYAAAKNVKVASTGK